jgi:predicted helicase
MSGGAQSFPLYYFDQAPQDDLLSGAGATGLVRRDAITDTALAAFRNQYGTSGCSKIDKEDLFYYVYGILHSPEYKTRFEHIRNGTVPPPKANA